MRTIIYARFSSDNQNPRSIEDQFAACRDRAAREGWPVLATFEDAATSGAAGVGLDQRPGLHAMLAMVETGGIDQVLVESTDRISRHTADSHIIRERIEFAGARLFTLFDGKVTPIIGLVKGFMDAQFRTDLAARVKRGQRGNIKEGRSTSNIAYGYRNANRMVDGDIIRGLREIDDDKARIVRRIFEEYAAGRSPMKIAAHLNADGVPGPRGKHWQASTIGGQTKLGFGILRNRLYIGELVYGRGKAVTNPTTRRRLNRPNHDEPLTVQAVPELRIISDNLWRRVEERREAGATQRPEAQRRPKHLLSGLCKCSVCGSNYVTVANSNFGCFRYHAGKSCTNNRYISRRKLERAVLDDLKREMLDPEVVAEYVREYHRDFARKAASLGRDRARLERQIDEANRKVERMVEAFAQGGSEFAEIRDLMTAARQDKERLTRELASLDAVPVIALHPHLAEDYKREVAELENALTADPGQELETIPRLRAMIARVMISPHPSGRGAAVQVVRQLDQVLALALGRSGGERTPVLNTGLSQ